MKRDLTIAGLFVVALIWYIGRFCMGYEPTGLDGVQAPALQQK